MTDLEKLICEVKKEVGNSPSKYRTWFYGSDLKGVPWCAVWVSYIFNKVGIPMFKTDGAGCFARNGLHGKWYESEYTEKSTTPMKGDIVTFVNNYKGRYENQDIYYSDHVGIVVNVDNTYIYTIEGNVGATNDTSKVTERKHERKSGYINGYYRPTPFEYKDIISDVEMKKGDKNASVHAYKAMLLVARELGIIKQTVNNDNVFGAGTDKATREVQTICNITVDGIAGKNTVRELTKRILNKMQTDKKKVGELY